MNVGAVTVAQMQWGTIVALVRVTRRQRSPKWIAIQMPKQIAETLHVELSDALRGSAPVSETTARERASKRAAAVFETASGPAALWDHLVNAFELVEKLETELARVCTKNGALAARAEFVELEFELAKKKAGQ